MEQEIESDPQEDLKHGLAVGAGLAVGLFSIIIGEVFENEPAGHVLAAGLIAIGATAWIRRDVLSRWWFLASMVTIALVHVGAATLVQPGEMSSQAFKGLAWIDFFVAYGLLWLVEKAVPWIGHRERR